MKIVNLSSFGLQERHTMRIDTSQKNRANFSLSICVDRQKMSIFANEKMAMENGEHRKLDI